MRNGPIQCFFDFSFSLSIFGFLIKKKKYFKINYIFRKKKNVKDLLQLKHRKQFGSIYGVSIRKKTQKWILSIKKWLFFKSILCKTKSSKQSHALRELLWFFLWAGRERGGSAHTTITRVRHHAIELIFLSRTTHA